MGAPMARNLIDAGFEVRVFNRTRAKAEKVAGNDGTIAESPRDAVKEADIVVSVADDRAVEDAVSESAESSPDSPAAPSTSR